MRLRAFSARAVQGGGFAGFPADANLLFVLHIRLSRRCAAVSAAALATSLLSGCASPANPRPPSLHLAEVPAPPRAERLGDQVVLSWETPAATTDGGRPELPLTAVVCREAASPGPTAGSSTCIPVLRLAVAPGAPGQAMNTLPSGLLAARALLAYRVEIQNRRGRSAGFSGPAFAAAGPPPSPAGRLTITGEAGGALVTWAATASSGTMELTRTVAVPPSRSPSTPGAGTGRPAASQAKAPGFAGDPSAPVLLRAAPAGRGANGMPAAGMLDAGVLDPRAEGTAFRYVAQRVESVTLGTHVLELRGLPSPPAVFTYVHNFAPAAPVGLTAIPALHPPSIDLSWEASTSPDLLGYSVYRRPATESAFTLLNAKPEPLPSFRDLRVQPGVAYVYYVLAVDRHHNQSAPSDEVRESVNP